MAGGRAEALSGGQEEIRKDNKIFPVKNEKIGPTKRQGFPFFRVDSFVRKKRGWGKKDADSARSNSEQKELKGWGKVTFRLLNQEKSTMNASSEAGA